MQLLQVKSFLYTTTARRREHRSEARKSFTKLLVVASRKTATLLNIRSLAAFRANALANDGRGYFLSADCV